MHYPLATLMFLLVGLFTFPANAQPMPPEHWLEANPVTSAYRAVVELEVNGEPLTYQRTVACRGILGVPGGRADLHVMSQRVTNPDTGQEEAVIVHQPPGCAMMRWYRRHVQRDLIEGEEIDVNNDVYGARSPNWPDYVPFIRYAIPADNPDVIHEYQLAANLEHPDSRVRFKSIRIFVDSVDDPREPYDEFHWLVRVEGAMESGEWDQEPGTQFARKMYSSYSPFSGMRFIPEKAWRRVPALVEVYGDETEMRIICQEEFNYRWDSRYQHREAWAGPRDLVRGAGRMGARIERGRGVFHPESFGDFQTSVNLVGNELHQSATPTPAPGYRIRRDVYPDITDPVTRVIDGIKFQTARTTKSNRHADNYTVFDASSKRVFRHIKCASVCPCWQENGYQFSE